MKLTESQLTGAKQGLRTLLTSKQKALLIWSEAGTGKTIVSSKLIDALYHHACHKGEYPGPVLVIVMASLREHWRRHFESQGYTVTVAESTAEVLAIRTRMSQTKAAVIISSNALAITETTVSRNGKKNKKSIVKDHILKLGKDVPWHVMLVDEAHELTNRTSKSAKAICGMWLGRHKRRTDNIWDCSKYRLILTGTPFGTGIQNCFHWIQRCLGGSPTNIEKIPKALNQVISNYYAFAEYYCHYKDSDYGRQYYGCKNKEGFAALVRSVVVRDILPNLPPKNIVVHKLSSDLSISEYKNHVSKAELLALAAKLIASEDPAIPEHISTERCEQGMAKIEEVARITKELLSEKKPVLLFAVHTDYITSMAKKLRKYNPLIIDGKIKGTKRQAHVDAFQSGKTNLLIVQIRAGGTGFTLTRATDVVLGELDWNPDRVHQAIARAYRIGLKHVLTVHFPIVQKSLDSYIYSRVKQKMKLNNEILELIIRGGDDDSGSHNDE